MMLISAYKWDPTLTGQHKKTVISILKYIAIPRKEARNASVFENINVLTTL